MTDTTNTPETSNKAPTHFAYHVTQGEGRSFFTKIGAAWANRDGKGFNIQLEALPIDGRVTLRMASEKKD